MIKKMIKRICNSLGFTIARIPLQPSDGLIKTRIGKFELFINGTHALPYYLIKYPQYSSNLPRLVNKLRDKYPELTLLDVGANIGDTVALVRSICCCPIICFEGNDNYFKLLQTNISQFDNVNAYKCFLGEKNEIINGYGEANKGTLKIVDNALGESIEIVTLDQFFKLFPLNSTAKIMKIDTDGFDLKIIRGALNYISTIKPVLFFEYDKEYLAAVGDDGISTINLLENLGYNMIIFYDNYGRFILSTDLSNHLLIEQLDNYIEDKNGGFEYYDICVFHAVDSDFACKFVSYEMTLQKNGFVEMV